MLEKFERICKGKMIGRKAFLVLIILILSICNILPVASIPEAAADVVDYEEYSLPEIKDRDLLFFGALEAFSVVSDPNVSLYYSSEGCMQAEIWGHAWGGMQMLWGVLENNNMLQSTKLVVRMDIPDGVDVTVEVDQEKAASGDSYYSTTRSNGEIRVDFSWDGRPFDGGSDCVFDTIFKFSKPIRDIGIEIQVESLAYDDAQELLNAFAILSAPSLLRGSIKWAGVKIAGLIGGRVAT